MVIEVGGKEYELNFGFGFLKYLNDLNGIKAEIQGTKVPTGQFGFEITLLALAQEDELALLDVLKGALDTEKSKPRNSELEGFILELILDSDEEDDKYTEFVKELYEEIKKQPLTGRKMKKLAK